MGGKTSQSTQSVQIPQEVLARYNAVNAQAQQAAQTPFQVYSYDPSAFVAPMTGTQLAGMQGINYATGQAQPFYDQATGQLMGGQMAAVPFYQASAENIGQGQYEGDIYNQLALQSYYGGLAGAMPYNQMAGMAFQNAGNYAYPLQMQAAQNIGAAQDVGSQLAAASLATQAGAGASAAPIQGAALQNLAMGQEQGQGLTAAALEQLQAGQYAASPFYGLAGASIAGAPFAAAPLQGSAADILGGARAGTAPYQAISTALGLEGARAVNPSELNAAAINRYMSPFISGVVQPTAALLNQQNQMAQAGQLGNAIRSGAFGGDRAGIAAANLNQQNQLAAGKVLGDLLQQGYGQALATAQQQQGLGLTAEQANRAAQASAAQQLLGIGQTGFGQDISSAQAQAALAQQIFGQQLGTGQAASALAGQLFGQGATAAQQQQTAAQALFGQGATTAQQQAALGQQLFGQGMSQAQQQAALSQLLFGQGTGAAQQQAALGQQLFGQGLAGGQALQGLGQQLFGQGISGSQQQAALGQQAFGQDLAAAQAQQAIAQGLYGMGAGTSQALAGLGSGAQQAALQGAQAQMAAGQIEQQTQQAGLQALYNQFLQNVAYPFQVSQFLANIAMGTGALSGSTTTTRQPGSIFSDVRAKEDVREIGKTFDGQPIHSFRYKGDPTTRMGLLAQQVEERHPEAVGLAGGLKTVNYDLATRDAARIGKEMEGGRVEPHHAGMGYADGGLAGPDPMEAQRKAEEMRQQDEIRRQKQAEDIKTTSASTQANAGLKPPMADAPKSLNIPSEPAKTPQLATASGDGLYSQDPRQKDVELLLTAAAMFSDRRLKENIKHIGHTHDGQKIYSYNIKGEPTTQIGLMADEVEDHHPEAVGRAKFADGGVPILGGSDLAQLIAAQAQMYGPYMDFGRNIGGVPGGAGYVPGATLPVGNLVTAPGLPARPSAASEVRDITDTGKAAYDFYSRVMKPSTTETETETETPGEVLESDTPIDTGISRQYRGGLVRADGGPVLPYDKVDDENSLAPKFMKANGGPVLPYDTVSGLGIPTSMDIPELQTAGSLPAARSTMDDLKDIVNVGSQAYDLYGKMKPKAKPEDLQEVEIKSKRVGQKKPMGPYMAQGGLAGRETAQDGGYFDLVRNLYRTGRDSLRLRNDPSSEVTDPALQQRIAEAGEAALRPPAAAPPAPRPRPRPAAPAAAPAVAPAASPAAGLGAAPMPEVPLEALREGAPALSGLAAAPPAPSPAAPPAGLAAAAQPQPAPQAAGAQPGRMERVRGFLDRNKDLLFPVLTGAAAAAATPTENTFTALLQGASAAARSYQDVRQRQAELAQIQAQTGGVEAQRRATDATTAAMISKGQIVEQGGQRFAVLADGSRMLLSRWMSLSPAQKRRVPLIGQSQVPALIGGTAPGAPGAAAVPGQTPEGKTQAEIGEGMVRQAPMSGTTSYLGQVGRDQIQRDISTYSQGETPESRPLFVQRNQKARDAVADAGNAAYNMGFNINTLARYVSQLPEGGIAAAGFGNEGRTAFANALNDIVRTVGGSIGASPESYSKYLISESDLQTNAAINKLTGMLGFAQTSGADQNSMQALEAAIQANPNLRMDKAGMQKMLATMMIDKQRAIDLENYVREAQESVDPGMMQFVSVDNLRNAFRREPMFNDYAYGERKKAIEKLLTSKHKNGVSAFEWLRGKDYTPERMNAFATWLLYGGAKDANGRDIIDPKTGDPVPRVAPIPGISNIILNQ